MNRFVWKLLRQHISIGQFSGFFLANLLGMGIILLSVQFYRDILPVFTQGDSFMKKEYIITTKRISTLGGLTGRSNTFSADEIEALRAQPFTKSVGAFTPARFKVSAGIGIQHTGIGLSTELFFESVPDEYVDTDLSHWHFDAESRQIPIIIPRSYLNLYNFGFAQSRNLPKLSENLTGLIQMDISIRGNGRSEQFTGHIAGFSNRLNTILVPQTFMEWANRTYAPGRNSEPARLIVEVKSPADPAITDYYRQQGYETEGEGLNAGKATHFLQFITAIVIGIGGFISLLSFYILLLSIFLLLQKNSLKLENLLLAGYSPQQVSRPYTLLAVTLNLAVLLLSAGLVIWIRGHYISHIRSLLPAYAEGSLLPSLLTGLFLFVAVTLLNAHLIRRNIHQIWTKKD